MHEKDSDDMAWKKFKSNTIEAWFKSSSELLHGNTDDRSVVIIGGSMVDDCLEQYLRSRTVRDHIADSFFDRKLDSFSSKINAAYTFGLIDYELWQELDLIRKLRNEFAHQIVGDAQSNKPEIHDKLTLGHRKIRGWCSTLKYPIGEQKNKEENPRERFCSSVSMVSILLLYGDDVPRTDIVPTKPARK